MASKQGPTGSSHGKHAKEKKQSTKNVYNKKNYKSSPNISTTTENSCLSKVKADSRSPGHDNSNKTVTPGDFVPRRSTDEANKFHKDSNPTAFLKHQNYQSTVFRHQNPNPVNFRPRNSSQPNPFRHPNQLADFRHRNPSQPDTFRHRNPNQFNQFRCQNPNQPDVFRYRSPSQSNNFRFPNPRYLGQNQRQSLMPLQSNNPNFIQRQSQGRFSRPVGNVPSQTHFQNHHRHQGPGQVKYHNETSTDIKNIQHKTQLQLAPSTNQLKSQNATYFKSYAGNSIITIKCKKKKIDSKTPIAKQKKKRNRNFQREERREKKKQQSSQQKINDTDLPNVVPLFSFQKCEAMIQDLRTQHEGSFDETAEMCPVCCDEVSDQKHRLEYCGHAYCKDCLLHLFESSENIPLNCEHGSDETFCAAPIVVADILWALKEKEPLKKVMYEKFLRSFVENRSDISYCPSPDCPMIFRVTEENMTVFKCPACSNEICTRCKELYHFTCNLQCMTSNIDTTLMNWMQEDPNNRKKCPSCSAPIEKNGGCTHMTCWKCKCHMCWLCLEVFPTGDMVYNHQPYCPCKVN